uniref:Histidine kinase n=1 Tax=Caenorhabditis tropicalis TaxID=1561998 RepID=A0A1I7TUJ1_9PELO
MESELIAMQMRIDILKEQMEKERLLNGLSEEEWNVMTAGIRKYIEEAEERIEKTMQRVPKDNEENDTRQRG